MAGLLVLLRNIPPESKPKTMAENFKIFDRDGLHRGLQLSTGQSISMTEKDFGSRTLLGAAMLHFFLMLNFWVSNLTIDMMAYDSNLNDIKSLEELEKTDLDLYFIDTLSQNFKIDNFGCTSNDCIQEKLLNRLVEAPYFGISGAYLVNDLSIDLYREALWDKQNSKYLMNVVPGIYYEAYYGMTTHKSFPFTEDFNKIIFGFLENGIIDMHHKRYRGIRHKIMIRKTKLGYVKEKWETIGLWELRSIFFIYIVLNLWAFLALFVELNHRQMGNMLIRILNFIVFCLEKIVLLVLFCLKCLRNWEFSVRLMVKTFFLWLGNFLRNYWPFQ